MTGTTTGANLSGRDGNWCAAWARENSESPAGTAVSVERFVLVELPLPWPAEIEKHELLQGVVPVSGARVQAIAGTQACGYRHTLICYWRPRGDWFSSYARTEFEVARPDLPARVSSLMRGEQLDSGTVTRMRDLLLCTHGTRDRCCAKLGGSLYLDLAAHLPERVRLWRTSHTGGHRFAPTGISFPEGLMWAGLDRDVALGLLGHKLPGDAIARHLRGCAAVGSGLAQAADGAAFARHGWSWLTNERRATVVDDDGRRASVDVELRHGDSVQKWTATVERGRTLPIALCGQPIESAQKTTTELIVRSLE